MSNELNAVTSIKCECGALFYRKNDESPRTMFYVFEKHILKEHLPESFEIKDIEIHDIN